MSKIICSAVSSAKIGATPGWDIAPSVDGAYIQLSGEHAFATVAIAVPAMQAGDVITGYYLVGRIESTGDQASLEVALCKYRPLPNYISSGGVSGVGGLPLYVLATSNTVLNSTNTGRFGFAETVGDTETFAAMITGSTTGDAIIQITGVVIEFTRIAA